jgi:hypothetical protein
VPFATTRYWGYLSHVNNHISVFALSCLKPRVYLCRTACFFSTLLPSLASQSKDVRAKQQMCLYWFPPPHLAQQRPSAAYS